ncbi:hypothetical protein AMS69_18525 [Haloarcula rubripromontorii]|uniref:Uncharacterized protein n=1 Tax=Haloarcula rubripromontorii TaxID=1705562 RepID=A0A0M9AGC9_9EURY|nr:hypothetical protein [Haloarcula rubripromontorii]KOX91487.1 hypothetical protein AMS69_18525 [Haloarcula rubripromontorii]
MSVTRTPKTVAQHDSGTVFASPPALRSPAKVASFVEQVLVELRHEAVAARYVTDLDQTGAKTIWCRVEHTTLDVDAAYVQIRNDPRLGVGIEPCSQATVRERLCQCLDHDRVGRVDVRPLAGVEFESG